MRCGRLHFEVGAVPWRSWSQLYHCGHVEYIMITYDNRPMWITDDNSIWTSITLWYNMIYIYMCSIDYTHIYIIIYIYIVIITAIVLYYRWCTLCILILYQIDLNQYIIKCTWWSSSGVQFLRLRSVTQIQLALDYLAVGLPRHVGREERKWMKIASCLTSTLCGKSWAPMLPSAVYGSVNQIPLHMFSIGLAKKNHQVNQVVKTLPGFWRKHWSETYCRKPFGRPSRAMRAGVQTRLCDSFGSHCL